MSADFPDVTVKAILLDDITLLSPAAVHEETIGEDTNPPAETIQAAEEDTMTRLLQS